MMTCTHQYNIIEGDFTAVDLSLYCLRHFFCSFSVSSPGTPITHMLYLLELSHSPWILSSGFFSVLSLLFVSAGFC